MSDQADKAAIGSLEFPEPDPELKGTRGLGLIKYFGPGAIVASLTIGSGETVFASRGGAVFGFSLLWLFFLAAIAKGFQVYSGSRHITLTGEHPLQSWNRIPFLRFWFPAFIAVTTLICYPFWLAGLPKMLGGLTNWIFDIPDMIPAEGGGALVPSERYDFLKKVWGTTFIAGGVIITMLQSYKWLERAQAMIVGLLLFSLLAAAIASSPDILEVLVGTFVPTQPRYPDWAITKYPADFGQRPIWMELALYAGAMGGGAPDYIGYIGMLREKTWGLLGGKRTNPVYGVGVPTPLSESPEQVERARIWLRPPSADVVISFVCVIIFTFTFVTLGAQVLGARQIAPSGNNLLTEQKDFLAQIHPSLTYLYQVGVFMAFIGTIIGIFEVYTRTAHECVMAVVPRWRNVTVDQVRPVVIVYCTVSALWFLWGDINPVALVTPAAVLSSVLTCGLWCFASAWADRTLLPKAYRMPGWVLAGLLLSGAFLTVLGVKGVVATIGFFLEN